MNIINKVLLISFFFSIVRICANPLPSTIISEIFIKTPLDWQIELDRYFLASEQSDPNIYKVKFHTSRYPDTFEVQLQLEDNEKFPVIVPDMIKHNGIKKAIEIQVGDKVTIGQNSNKSEAVISRIGADSSLCVCPWENFVSSDTVTMGSENRIPSKSVTLVVLSIKDSLPVQGLGLFDSDGTMPHLRYRLDHFPFTLPSFNACGTHFFWIQFMGQDYNNRLATIDYSYSPLLPDTDTVYIDPVSIKEHHTLFKDGYTGNLSVVNSNKNLLFIIKCGKSLTGQGQLQITDISGKLVKKMNIDMARTGAISLAWDKTDTRGRALSNGVYLATLIVNGKTLTEKFTLSGSR